MTRYPLYRGLGGSPSCSGRVRKISPPTGIRSPDRPARSEQALPVDISLCGLTLDYNTATMKSMPLNNLYNQHNHESFGVVHKKSKTASCTALIANSAHDIGRRGAEDSLTMSSLLITSKVNTRNVLNKLCADQLLR